MADITYSRRRLMQGTAALGFGLTGTGLAEVSPEGARALAQTPAAAESADGEAAAVAVDAYIYFYSLVTMDVTRRQLTNVEPGKMPGAAR